MTNSTIPSDLYNKKTLFTLSGASVGVWLFTTVIGSAFNFDISNYKWIGLFVAMFLSFTGAYSIGKFNFQQYTIIFFNGLLIYVTASGIDSINHSTISEGEKSLKASIIPYVQPKIWWAPKELTDSIFVMNQRLKQQERLLAEYKIEIADVVDSCSLIIEKLKLETEIVNERSSKVHHGKLSQEHYRLKLELEKCIKSNREVRKDTILLDVSEESKLMLKSSSILCNNLIVRLTKFRNSGRNSPSGITYLQKDMIYFERFLEKYISQVDYLLNNENERTVKKSSTNL